MKECHYYAFRDRYELGNIHAGDLASEEYPILVNCAGNVVKKEAFATYNAGGRSDYYLIYIESGGMEVDLPKGRVSVKEGDVILFPPQYPYRYGCTGNVALSYLWVHFTGSYAGRMLEECGFDSLPFVKSVGGHHGACAGFRRMFEIFESSTRLQRQELACALERLLLDLSLAMDGARGERGLERSLNYIHTSYHTDLRIPRLAQMEHLSNSRYVAVFKERTGLSPNQYVTDLRISIACDQLRNSEQSVKEIALSVGYADPHFFSRLFKKKTGVSPQKYRDTNE